MPTYCYTNGDGRTIDRDFPFGEAPGYVRFNRDQFYRDRQAEGAGGYVKGSSTPCKGGWPITCYASGVNAAQAPELRAFFQKHGENVEVTKGGDPVYTSAVQRRRLLKLRGLHDRNAYC